MMLSKYSPITAPGTVAPAAAAAAGLWTKLLRTPNKTILRDYVS